MYVKNKPFLLLTVVFIMIVNIFTTSTFSSQHTGLSARWYREELNQKKRILEAFWRYRVLNLHEKSVNDFKSIIKNSHYPKDILWEREIDQLFNDAINKKVNFNSFYEALKNHPFVMIEIMNEAEKLIPVDSYKDSHPHINQSTLKKLHQYILDKHYSASITLGSNGAKLITPDFQENHFENAFAIHSVGKVFTGILVLLMIEENVFTEEDLLKPVQLDESVRRQLPQSVQEQLEKVTLHQLMTHRAGLGDYLGAYGAAISQGHIPEIKHIDDFVPFVEDATYPIGEVRYSNVGLLLVGLAIKHAYERKLNQAVNYDDILSQFIIDKVGMTSFSPWKPKNAKFNLNDKIAPYIVGSPAGGYWLTSFDLAKFGQWLYLKAKSDAKFRMLIEKYGQEFYYGDRQVIAHGGGIPSSFAFFSVSLKTGAVQAILTDQPPIISSDLKEMILRKMYSKRITSSGDALAGPDNKFEC